MLESFVEAGLELLMKENIVSISVHQLTWFVNEKCYLRIMINVGLGVGLSRNEFYQHSYDECRLRLVLVVMNSINIPNNSRNSNR